MDDNRLPGDSQKLLSVMLFSVQEADGVLMVLQDQRSLSPLVQYRMRRHDVDRRHIAAIAPGLMRFYDL